MNISIQYRVRRGGKNRYNLFVSHELSDAYDLDGYTYAINASIGTGNKKI